MKSKLLVAILALLLLTVVAHAEQPKTAKVDRQDIPDFVGYVENEIVVKFDQAIIATMDKASVQSGRVGHFELDELGIEFDVLSVRPQFPNAKEKAARIGVDLSGWHKITFGNQVDALEAVRAYEAIDGVIDAQPIGIHTVTAAPNDGNYAEQWHLNQPNDHDIDAPEAWDIETGDNTIIVAILDSGVRYFHKDLGGANASYSNPTAADGNMWINWAEKNGSSGVDDDGNGFVDDWVGWDFVDGATQCWSGEDCNGQDNDPRDFNGHGTHCAGNIAALNNNGYGTCAPAGGWGNGTLQASGNGVKVMALRIGWSGRYWFYEVGYVRMDFIAEALYYAADNGAKIASCSWGSSNSGGLSSAIDYFIASGGIIFKAAGNDGSQTADYMCGLNNSAIVSVAATDSNDCKADFSTYGTWVDISAPGTGILSTYHDHGDPQSDYVAALDGTSMATPLTASTAALIWSQNPGWSRSQVLQQLYDSADDIYGYSCNSSYGNRLGAGRINAFNAVNTGTPPPVADFSASPTSGCANLTVNFTDLSSGDITGWSWDFGDGGSSTAQNPSHQYTSGGTYTVSLTVSGPGGNDTETKSNYITINEGPTAAFTGSPTSGTEPLTVNFTDQSSGALSWSWDFGDGGSSTQQNPSHEYSSAGTYTVSLTVSNSCGNDSETKTDYITVGPCLAPVANFEGAPNSGEVPLTVNFSDLSTNSPTSWSWDFGDGGSSTQQNPSHEYTSAGTYTVSLTATNGCGSDVETRADYITVTCTAPVAGFSGSPTSGDAPLTVNFTDQSTGATSWSWDFGDGGSSTQQNPSHEYTSAGTYTVSLTATNGCGSDVETRTDYITVIEPQQGGIIGEVAQIYRNQTGNGADWYTVNLNNTYTDPVVVMRGLTFNGGQPTHLRVRNAGTNSFEWQMEEWAYLDGNHTNEYCPYIVVESGVHTLEDGTILMAGTASVNNSFATIDFPQSFSSTPTLITGVASDNDTYPCITRTRNLGGSSFQIKVQEEEAADGSHGYETVAWIAIEQGTGTNNSALFEAGRTSNSVTHEWYNIGFSAGFSQAPIFLCHDDTYDGGNTCGTRFRNASTSSVEVFIEEEKSNDSEINHITEVVSYLAWGAAGNILSQGAQTFFAEEPIYEIQRKALPQSYSLDQNRPNPFNPTTTISYSLPEGGFVSLKVFNILGQEITTLVDDYREAGYHQVVFDASSYASGIYFYRIQTEQYTESKRMLLLK